MNDPKEHVKLGDSWFYPSPEMREFISANRGRLNPLRLFEDPIGVLMKVRYHDGDEQEMLIGGINDMGGTCDHCAGTNNLELIAYRRVYI